MPKSIHRPEHVILCELIRQFRVDAGFKQIELSTALGKTQSFVSDVERGTRRLDIIELRDLCAVLGVTLPDAVEELERQIGAMPRPSQRKQSSSKQS